MNEKQRFIENSQLELTAEIYSKASEVLASKKPFYNPDGPVLKASSFFCDQKDNRGSSDIAVEKDILGGENGLVTITTVRQYPHEKSLIRELKLSKDQIKSLVVREREHHGSHFIIRTLYSSGYDSSKISLESVSDWLSEAKINIEAKASEPICDEIKNPRIISFSSRRLINKLGTGAHLKKSRK